MLCLAPLMLSKPKATAWAILGMAGIASSLARPDAIWTFALIDAISAALLLHSGKYLPQKAIALISAGMLCIHGGFIAGQLVHGEADLAGYADLQIALGWAQFAILALWGGVDAVRAGTYRLLQRVRHPHTVRGFR